MEQHLIKEKDRARSIAAALQSQLTEIKSQLQTIEIAQISTAEVNDDAQGRSIDLSGCILIALAVAIATYFAIAFSTVK